jgi:hypothetical protein
MILLLPIWLVLFLLLIGAGLLVVSALVRLGGPTFRGPVTTFQTFWFGYVFVLLLLEIWSLVLPIRRPTLFVLLAFAVLGFWLQRKAVLRRLSSFRAHPRFAAAVALLTVAVVLIVAARSAQPVGWYDTLLYHLQVVKWARTYAAVPGIANLHYRLAYNNSVHLFAALTDVFWTGRAAHIANGFLVSVVAVQFLTVVLRPLHRHARLRAGYCLLVLPYIFERIATNEVASLSSDLPLNFMCAVIVLELVSWDSRAGRRSDLRVALAVALASVATTTKLGGAGMLVVSGLVALFALHTQGRSVPRALGLLALPVLVLIGYLARQSVLSGWLLFPAPIGNLHLPWSLPEAETLDQFRWIQSWARIAKREPAEVLDHGMWHWFEVWFPRFASRREFIVLLVAGALAIYRLAQSKAKQLRWHTAALAASVLSLVVWFRGAPDPRFGAGFFWALLAVIAAPVLAELMRERTGRFVCLALALLLTYWTEGVAAELPSSDYGYKLKPIRAQKMRPPVEVSPGLTVGVPEGESDRCGNEPLPCTPYPVRQRLRRPADLGSGFLF